MIRKRGTSPRLYRTSCHERIPHKDYVLTGELLGELPTPSEMPTVEVQWKRIGMY